MAVTQEVRCKLRYPTRRSSRARRAGWTTVRSTACRWAILAAAFTACLSGTGRSSYAENPQLQQAIDTYASAMEKTDRDQRLEEFARAEQLFRQVIAGTDAQPADRER